MTIKSAVTRRNFIRMGSALPVSAAMLPAMARSAFAAAPAAPAPAPFDIGAMDLPANIVLINGNEFPYGPTPAAVDIMHKMAVNGNRYYMSETRKFAAEVAAYHGLKTENVSLYAGSSEPLLFTAMAFTSPTRSLVMADPSYESAARTAKNVGAKVYRIPLKADFSYDVKAMVAADPNAGLLYICNPNNPTGTIVKRSDIEWVLENKPAGSILLVDEAYIHFSDAESVADLVGKDKDIVVLRTFSKIYSMGGLRFGYAMARPDLMAKLHLYGTNFMATTAIQCAKTQLFDKQLVPLRKQTIAETREKTFDFLSKNNYKFTPSQANHFMLSTKEHTGAGVGAAMAQKNVVIGRTWPIWPNYARVTVGSPSEMLTFQSAFLEVMQMPVDQVSAVVHPYPHLRDAHVC